jgi:hypothetical protein
MDYSPGIRSESDGYKDCRLLLCGTKSKVLARRRVLIPIKCGVLDLGSQVRRCENWEERAHEMMGAISDGDSRVR